MRHIFTLLILFISFNFALTQEFESKDIKIFPGEFNSHENFHMDQQNNYFVAGRGTGEIDFDFGSQTNSLPANSYRDLYLAKYNSNGDLDWLLSFEGSTTVNQIRALASDDEGNLYVGGAFSGSLSLTDDGQNDISSFGSTSMFVAKFDVNGNLVWQFTVGDTNFSQYPDALFIRENRLIIQFVFDGTFDVDPGPNTEMLDGNSNAMLVYDLDGAFMEAYSHRGGTVVRSSVMDDEGNIYLSGLFSGLVSLDYKTNASIITNGFFDAFVVKYDTDFNKVWHKRVGKSFTSLTFYEMGLDANDDLIIGAGLVPEVSVGEYESSSDANYLIHVSKDGDYMNLTEILPESSFIIDIATNSNNQVLLSATFSEVVDIDPGEGVNELNPVDGDNVFLAVYEPDLSLTNSDQISSTSLNTISVHVSDSDDVYVLTDFEGEGKCILGNTNIYAAENEENFALYKLDIDGCTPTSEALEVAACDEVIVNGEPYTVSGEYEQILTNAEGCDSTLMINATIYPSTQTDTSIVSCGLFNFNGEIIAMSGTYNFVLSSFYGCDSVITIALDVVELNKEVTIDNNELIASESEGDSYQWWDCDTDMMVEGANERTFAPDSDGSYRVQIFKSACSFFSNCIPFTLVNVTEPDFEISLSPNPTDGLLYLKGDFDDSSLNISLYDFTGREIMIKQKKNENKMIDLRHVNPGVYLIRLQQNDKLLVKKIVVQ